MWRWPDGGADGRRGEGSLNLSALLDAQLEERRHVDHRDDDEDAAGRWPVWLGNLWGEPGHEPRGEDWHQVEIWP